MAAYTVNAGAMRTRITFQKPTVAQGADGAQTPTWATIATIPTVWSQWVHDHGQEMQAEAGKSVERATVTIRYRDDILPSYAILDDGGSRWQLISAPENVSNANRWTQFRVERVKGTL